MPGTKRNEFSTPATYVVDLRVGRIIRFGERYRLSLFAEGFNLFNRPNVLNVNTTAFAATSAATQGCSSSTELGRSDPLAPRSGRRYLAFTARFAA